MVVVDESSESVVTCDRPGCLSWWRVGCLEAPAAVRPLVVVVLEVLTRAVPAADIRIALERWADFTERMNAPTRTPLVNHTHCMLLLLTRSA